MPHAWRSELESILDTELRDGVLDNPFRPAVLPVVPLRVVISRERASNLRRARERQGVWIGEMKRKHPDPPAAGVVVPYEGDLEER